jgi:1-acyl-sn-glycerol-3-phosphate acyltransferase
MRGGMSGLVASWRLARATAHVLAGVATVLLRFPALDAAARQQRVQRWSAQLLRHLGVELRTQGLPKPGAKLLVANHISWLDIAAIHAVLPEARFVSKADVKHWPVLGTLVAGVGTLFIEREKKRDALRVVHQMAEAMRAGDTVAVFPEGTTADGRTLLPFHANLLQAAIATETAIQPVALRFSDAHGAVSRAAEFLGETTLLQSLWRIAAAQSLVVSVSVLPPQATAHADRRALAESLRAQIDEAMQALPA